MTADSRREYDSCEGEKIEKIREWLKEDLKSQLSL